MNPTSPTNQINIQKNLFFTSLTPVLTFFPFFEFDYDEWSYSLKSGKSWFILRDRKQQNQLHCILNTAL